MTGWPSPNTRRLLVEEGGFLYDRDSFGDELPYWTQVGGKPHLVIPISCETNDNRYNEHLGFATAGDFFVYMKDAFDTLRCSFCVKLVSSSDYSLSAKTISPSAFLCHAVVYWLRRARLGRRPTPSRRCSNATSRSRNPSRTPQRRLALSGPHKIHASSRLNA